MSIEAMKQWLEALEIGHDYANGEKFENSQRFKGYEHLAPDDETSVKQIENAITSIRQAIAEAKLEEKRKLLPRCFADYQPNHAVYRSCEWCAVKTECQTGDGIENLHKM